MIIEPTLPSGYTIFCDDVRHEVTGKATYVGTYASHLFVASFPVQLPRFYCVVTYREETDSQAPITIKALYDSEGEETELARIEYDIPPEAINSQSHETFIMREARFFIELSPLPIERAGKIKIRAFRRDDEIRLGILIVEKMKEQNQKDST